jgi:OmpA family
MIRWTFFFCLLVHFTEAKPFFSPSDTTKTAADSLFNAINFDSKSHILRRDKNTLATLDSIYHFLVNYPMYNLRLEGYCDNEEYAGNDNEVALLSYQRAFAIRNHMISKGLAECRFTMIWRGSANPLFPNDHEENRRLNRRVECGVYLNENNNLSGNYFPEHFVGYDRKEEAMIMDYNNISPYLIEQTLAILQKAITENPDLLIIVCRPKETSEEFVEKTEFLLDALFQRFTHKYVMFSLYPCHPFDAIYLKIFQRQCHMSLDKKGSNK